MTALMDEEPPEKQASAGGGALFWIALPLCAAVAAWGILDPGKLGEVAELFTHTVFGALDWFYMAAVTSFLLLCIWLALGRYGSIKLGGPEDEPEFSTVSWIAMLFAAGMGAGLLFWGAAEPLTHLVSPPIGVPSTAATARRAMVLTNFHWGLHAWAVYGIGGLVLAYFGFRKKTPYLAGAPLRAAFRGRWVEPVALLADVIAVLAVAFGVAGSLGMGTLQVQAGLHAVAGVSDSSLTVRVIILVSMAVCYMLSASTGLDKGIKWLSNINMGLAVLLLIFVLGTGPTGFLLSTFVTSLGDYASNLVGLSLRLYPFSDIDDWLASWTLTYFIWWIAWTPFVGIFIARISRGRTVRSFVLAVLLAPSLVSVLWFSVFGGAGFDMQMHGAGGLGALVREDVTAALFSIFDRMPMSELLSGIAIALVFIFIVTSVDSATYVLGMLTSRGSQNPSASRKLAWGIGLGALASTLLFAGDIAAVRAVAVLGAVPFTFILLLQVAALLRVLRTEREP
jgi:glycine betaine transporter